MWLVNRVVTSCEGRWVLLTKKMVLLVLFVCQLAVPARWQLARRSLPAQCHVPKWQIYHLDCQWGSGQREVSLCWLHDSWTALCAGNWNRYLSPPTAANLSSEFATWVSGRGWREVSANHPCPPCCWGGCSSHGEGGQWGGRSVLGGAEGVASPPPPPKKSGYEPAWKITLQRKYPATK